MCTRAAARAICVLSIIIVHGVAQAGEHPALLARPGEIARWRHLCGVGEPATGQQWGRFGAFGAEYQRMRAFCQPAPGDLLPGELLAIAFLHLVEPEDRQDAERVAFVRRELQAGRAGTLDLMDQVIALDWCWNALDDTTRKEFLLRAREWAAPLAPSDSPLEPRTFRPKLAALALALAVDESDDDSASWAGLRSRLLVAGRQYFARAFPQYVAWRGMSPTSSASGPDEAGDTAMAIEIGQRLFEQEIWPDYAATLGRWLEPYVLTDASDPHAVPRFVHDDGDHAPTGPVVRWQGFQPLTAHLLAARTRDPAAALVASRVEGLMRAAPDDPATAMWCWVPILFDVRAIPACDPASLPTARNLGGAVLLRGGEGDDAIHVWIDAGQPFLRRRQHFDAGHFLIHRGSALATDAADDVLFEAILTKEGEQRLGNAPFDFEQFATSTIAHNAVVLWEPTHLRRWYGNLYLPVGGQRCVENTCTDFITPLAEQKRETGRQLAYGQHTSAAYLALDLTPAYDPDVVQLCTREFVFVLDRALIIIDRVRTRRGRTIPTWIINVPARPQADGGELTDIQRIAGPTNDAGVWQADGAQWLRWSARDDALWLHAAVPAARAVRVVGGPAEPRKIETGTFAGRAYVGGAADSFERLITPSRDTKLRNAWYRLGRPTLLGPDFAKRPVWGRVEVEPLTAEPSHSFVTVLVVDDASGVTPPAVSFESETVQPPADEEPEGETAAPVTRSAWVLRVRLGQDSATLRVPADGVDGGTLEVRGTRDFTWPLPTGVEPDPPLPTKVEGDATTSTGPQGAVAARKV